MSSFEPDAFAREWAQAWNARDLDRVLGHFSDAIVFSSPKAVDAVGQPTVRGKPALRAYWERALTQISTLEFRVVAVMWDSSARRLAIIYDRNVNGRSDRAIELLTFDSKGLVAAGEVFYGVSPTAA
ncbi:MAG TPA: nuclear transport factor 2 family protein [Gemmatimonadales bacterium]|nr:nuclear transport factor 2 family protein [Gemmatimonadales bacterium]